MSVLRPTIEWDSAASHYAASESLAGLVQRYFAQDAVIETVKLRPISGGRSGASVYVAAVTAKQGGSLVQLHPELVKVSESDDEVRNFQHLAQGTALVYGQTLARPPLKDDSGGQTVFGFRSTNSLLRMRLRPGFWLIREMPWGATLRGSTLAGRSVKTLARQHEDVKYGLGFNVAQPCRRTHAVAFQQAGENHEGLFLGKPGVVEQPRLWLSEALAALLALVALNTLLAVRSGLDHLGSAIVTGHRESP
jgi:hypothetical protein